mgnify:CR=1 FL=1
MASGRQKRVTIVGGGPAGLFAAEIIAKAGHAVSIYDCMPSPARKFLMAGRGGLNLTHSEALETFLARYSDSALCVRDAVRSFPPADLVAWADGLGAETFVGSSGRIFPKAMKASPLLRAWLQRLNALGVVFHLRHRWTGFTDAGGLAFVATDNRPFAITPDAALIATGGASWPRLGADGAWVSYFESSGIRVTPLEPANCGVEIAWSENFARRFAGTPLKRIAVSIGNIERRGEAIVTATGLEGGVIYALAPEIRKALRENPHRAQRATEAHATARLRIDLKPDAHEIDLANRLAGVRGTPSTSNLLRKAAGLTPAAINLLREPGPLPAESLALARRIKAIEVDVVALAGLARAISTAGGVDLATLTPNFAIKNLPHIFAAGEMLDWEAPTGGYLLQGVFATAAAAAAGLLKFLEGVTTTREPR